MDIARINVSDKSILPLQLINTGEEVRSMAFSNDGRTLVISKGEFGGKMNLWQVRFNTTTNLPNGKPILLNGISSTDDINPSFSTDGKIAYSKRVFERHLWIISAKNNNVDPEQLTTTGQLNYYPELTYDGKILGFTSHRTGNGLIYTYNLQTQKLERISNDWEKNLREVWISFSQDTYPIYYSSTKGGSFQIWKMESPNSPPLAVTKTIPPQKDISASISPNGNTLVFLSNRNGNDDVWTYDLRSAKINQLTSDHSNERFPVWSPDGNQIAFLSDKNGSRDIWVMDSDGKNQRALVDEKSDESWIQWSADGNWIYYSTNRNRSYNIWKVRLDNRELIPITNYQSTSTGLPENGRYNKFTVRDDKIVFPLEERKAEIFIMSN